MFFCKKIEIVIILQLLHLFLDRLVGTVSTLQASRWIPICWMRDWVTGAGWTEASPDTTSWLLLSLQLVSIGCARTICSVEIQRIMHMIRNDTMWLKTKEQHWCRWVWPSRHNSTGWEAETECVGKNNPRELGSHTNIRNSQKCFEGNVFFFFHGLGYFFHHVLVQVRVMKRSQFKTHG